MNVHVSYTIEVDDEFRRELNRYYGEPGKATRNDVKRWFEAHGQSGDLILADQSEES